MNISTLLVLLLLLAGAAFLLGRTRANVVAQGEISSLHSLPGHYGLYTAVWSLIPALGAIALWLALAPGIIDSRVVSELPPRFHDLSRPELGLFLNDVKNLADGGIVSGADYGDDLRIAADRLTDLRSSSRLGLWTLVISMAVLGLVWGWRSIRRDLRAREKTESVVVAFLIASSMVAILTTIGIVLSVLFESIRFFDKIPIADFLFGLKWSPQTAIRAGQVGSSGAFGFIPLLVGTLLISSIAMLVAVPIGLISAIYLAEYAHRRARAILKPMLEILAGIPTVVYGFFAALTVAPAIRGFGESMGLDVASESALAAGLVMGVMIIPFVSSLSDDVIQAVPQAMRDGSFALGATQSETIRKVVIPAALPGIVGGVLLAVSRAIGETMIVVMAAGLAANLTLNPLEAVTTVTVQIVTLLVGDQEFDSAKTLAAFALGLMLFIVTLCLNVIALHVVRRYREQYE